MLMRIGLIEGYLNGDCVSLLGLFVLNDLICVSVKRAETDMGLTLNLILTICYLKLL